MDSIEVFEADDGWHFHRKAPNGEIISEGEAYSREEDAWRAAHRANPDLVENES